MVEKLNLLPLKYYLLTISIWVNVACKTSQEVVPANEEFMTAIWLDCGNPLDCSKSATTKFEAISVSAIKFTDAQDQEVLQIEGSVGASLNAERISITIPYSGIGSYSSNTTSLYVHYSNASINWNSKLTGGGAYVEVFKDENNIVEGNFRYIALSTYNNATPPVIGHDEGLFKAVID